MLSYPIKNNEINDSKKYKNKIFAPYDCRNN